MKVLIIQDQIETAQLLSKIITGYGCEVNIANQGSDALNLLGESTNIDLALVGWRMPVMSGLDLIKELRTRQHLKTLKIIMVAGMNDLGNVDEAFSAGANEYLMKPFSRMMILEKLKLCGLKIKDE